MVNKPKNKGTAFETAVVRYLRWALDEPRIDRMALHGSQDVGDIANVYYNGKPVVIECKNTKQPNTRKHWQQTEDEMGNADTNLGILIWHKPGLGYSSREKIELQHVIVNTRMLDLISLMHAQDCGCSIMPICVNPMPRQKNKYWTMPLWLAAHWLNHGQDLGPEN